MLVGTSVARTQNAANLAKDLSNPVSSRISVPFQFNWDLPGPVLGPL